MSLRWIPWRNGSGHIIWLPSSISRGDSIPSWLTQAQWLWRQVAPGHFLHISRYPTKKMQVYILRQVLWKPNPTRWALTQSCPVWSWYTGARDDTFTATQAWGSHTGCRDVSTGHLAAIFILSSSIYPLRLKNRWLPPCGMDFSIARLLEIESSRSAEVWKGNDSPKSCLLLSYKEQARMQHDKVQVQLITLLDMFWTPVPTHSPCFGEMRGRVARAEKLWAVSLRAVCKPASGAWRETARGRLCCEPDTGTGEWEQKWIWGFI